jgi:hypothetical protein
VECGWQPQSTEGEGPGPLRGLTAGRSTIEGRCRSRGLSLQGELLEEKLVANGVEGGEGYNPLNESLQVAVARTEATQKVQHQGTVGDGLAEVAERVRHALHLAVVFSHGEIPLRELVKLGIEVRCLRPEPPGSSGTVPRERATPVKQCPPGRG